MKSIKVAKLPTECSDKATELKGTLTHWTVDMGGRVDYLFKPKGLTEEGQPRKSIYFEPERLNLKEKDFETVDIPFEILGSIVEDLASGFRGMAVKLMMHVNGCFHVYIQPKGVNKKTGDPITSRDFDLRICKGEMIKKMSESELKQSKKDKPSPTGDTLSMSVSMSDVDTQKHI